MHLEPFGLSVHAFGWTGQENIIPTCREAGNYYIIENMFRRHKNVRLQFFRWITNPEEKYERALSTKILTAAINLCSH